MNKKFFFIFIFILIFTAYFLGFGTFLSIQISKINNKFNHIYYESIIAIESIVEKYFFQLSKIENLTQTSKENQKYKTLYENLQFKYKELSQNNLTDLNSSLELETVKVLRYFNMNDNSVVVLDKEYKDENTINALITFDGYSAGIVKYKQEQSLGYFNSNFKCNYTVYIGKEKATGITNGYDEDGNLLIKYIPKWHNVTLDDEVVTSGMDNIFPVGILVGKVIKIQEDENTKSLLVKPYAKLHKNRYFYIY